MWRLSSAQATPSNRSISSLLFSHHASSNIPEYLEVSCSLCTNIVPLVVRSSVVSHHTHQRTGGHLCHVCDARVRGAWVRVQVHECVGAVCVSVVVHSGGMSHQSAHKKTTSACKFACVSVCLSEPCLASARALSSMFTTTAMLCSLCGCVISGRRCVRVLVFTRCCASWAWQKSCANPSCTAPRKFWELSWRNFATVTIAVTVTVRVTKQDQCDAIKTADEVDELVLLFALRKIQLLVLVCRGCVKVVLLVVRACKRVTERSLFWAINLFSSSIQLYHNLPLCFPTLHVSIRVRNIFQLELGWVHYGLQKPRIY